MIVAISSRALFDLSESHRVFEEQGVEAYHAYQVAHETEILAPGVAFSLVRKLLALNERLGDRGRVEVILLSRNSSDTGLRVFNSIRHHELGIRCAAFTSGASPYRYVSAFGAHLFCPPTVTMCAKHWTPAAQPRPSCQRRRARRRR